MRDNYLEIDVRREGRVIPFQKDSSDFYVDGMLVNTTGLDKHQKHSITEKQSLAVLRKRKGSYN